MVGDSYWETYLLQTSRDLHPSGAVGTEHSLLVEVIEDTLGFDKIRDQWSALIERTSAHIFQTYEWQRLWWEHFGRHRSLHIVLFRHEGVLVGIAPFFLYAPSFLGVTISRDLYLLGSGVDNPGFEGVLDGYTPSDYLDIIALPEFEKSVARTLLKHLGEIGDLYDKILLNELPEDSILMREVVPRLGRSGWKAEICRGAICPRLIVPDSLEAFKHSLDSKVRYQLSQTRRAVTERGMFSLEVVQSREELDRSFSEFVRLHQRRWSRIGYPGSFANDSFRVFLHDVTKAFLTRGWLWFRTARSNGRCVAVECAFKFKDVMYDYLKAFDDKSPEAKHRPGRALLLFLIEEAIRDKVRVVDFLRGGEKYKLELTPHAQFNWRVVAVHPLEKEKQRSLAHRAIVFFSHLHRRTMKGSILLRVYVKEWGVSRFAPYYVLFLWKRLRRSPVPKYSVDTSQLPRTISELKMEQTLELEVITDSSRFLALHNEWNHLVEVCPTSIFQTFDWQWVWWKYFGEGLHLHIITFRKNGRLIGIAPLYLGVASLFGIKLYRRLRFMGGGVEDSSAQWDLAQFGPSDYLDIIAIPEAKEEVARGFLGYLRKEAWLDGTELENIPPESLLVKALVPMLKQEGHPYKLVQDHVCPRITLPASLEEYLRGRSAKFRYQLSQTRKAASTLGLFSIETVQSTRDLQKALAELVRLHQLRWNRIGYPGVFADLRFRSFQEEISQRFLENGWLWFKTVRTSGSCIAARMGFRFKNSICDYIAGFDDRVPEAKRRPGYALLLSMIEDAIEEKKQVFDLLRGYETYKFDFTSEIPTNWKIVVWNPLSWRTPRVRLYHVVQYLEFLIRKVIFEGVMFKVHYREHGFPKFLFRYIAFRWKKLSEKVINDLKMAKLLPDDH
jgi:CelD/BcsL family acetyltransferase involved in cellulose biosynthesis